MFIVFLYLCCFIFMPSFNQTYMKESRPNSKVKTETDPKGMV